MNHEKHQQSLMELRSINLKEKQTLNKIGNEEQVKQY